MVANIRPSIVSVSIFVCIIVPSCASSEESIRPNIQSMMEGMPAGTVVRATKASRFGDQFAPNGEDLLALMDIQGASYVVKAPASTGSGYYIDCDVRYFIDGKELTSKPSAAANEPDRKSVGAKDEPGQGRSPSRMCVVDILVWPDWVSSSGYSYRVRIRPLDDGRWEMRHEGFFKSPEKHAGWFSAGASLYQRAGHEVVPENYLPLACLSLGPKDKSFKPSEICGADDPEQVARASRLGIVFYIRLHQTPTTTGALSATVGLQPSRR